MPAPATLVLLALACNGDKGSEGYDIDTWNSPLASEYDGEGDAAEGERLYFEEHWTDDTTYAFTCDSCHGSDPGDSVTVDAGDLNRPAHTTYNVAWREQWKSSQDWDEEESTILGAYGGQICVTAYFPDGSSMTAEQAAHLEAWMRDNRDADAGAETAAPLDYGFNSWDTADDFEASVQDADGAWLYGSDLGEVSAGQANLARYCGSCHGGSSPVFYTAETSDLPTLVSRIRKTDFGGAEHDNSRMPRQGWDRLSDDDLVDLLAALTEGREGE